MLFDRNRLLTFRAPIGGAALLTALLLVRWLPADIVITEISYAPVNAAGASQENLEFVEIFNDGPEVYDLSGCLFTSGIRFQFPEGSFLGGRSYLVVCRDRAALEAAYGITNTAGNFDGVLDNAGERLALANPQGAVLSRVTYNDRGQWPSGAKGTGHTLSIRNPYLDPEDAGSWVLSLQRGGTPGRANFGGQVAFEDSVIIPEGAVWRYFKGTEEPPATWKTIGFDDTGWFSGPTGIGYGDGDDATILTDMQNGYMTIFCRRTFDISDLSTIDDLVLKIVYDDGFYAYLNNTQVASRNVAGTGFNVAAPSAIEPTSEDIDLSAFKGVLVTGRNVLCVQVHNAGLSSSDLSFIPSLLSRRRIEPESTATVPVVVNEGHFRTAAGRFVELYNTSAAAVDLSGFHLTDDFSNLTRYRIASGVVIPARGFRVFTEAQLGFDLSLIDGVKERIAIALVNAAGTRVVDARIFEPRVDGKSEARLPDGAATFAPAADPTPGAANAAGVVRDVVFNEIHYNPLSGRDDDEFIELYNRGSVARDIGGWRVEGVSFQFPPGTVLPAGGYLVIAADPARIRGIYGLGSGVVVDLPWSGRLSNSGERLRLLDLDGNTADQVSYRDGGEWPLWADGSGSSLEKIDPFSESSVAGSWDASDDSSKAATQSFSYTAVHGGGESDFGIMLMEEGIAIIDDLQLQANGTGPNLISNGTFDANTTSWRIEGTHIHSGRTTSPAERITGAGSLKLICWNGGGDYKVNRIETDTGTQSTGTSYRITYNARWVVGGRTLLTIGDYTTSNPASAGLAGAQQLQVPARLGTPGAINSVTQRQIERTGAANLGPAIDRVSHSPVVPEGSEAVTVTARVRDPNGVAGVRLFYRTESPAGAFSQLAMSSPGGGIYTATIPGQALGVRVLFYIEATDGLGQVERFPRDILRRTHPPVVNPAAASPNDSLYCMYRHDTRFVSTNFHSYRFVLNQLNETELATRRVLSNEMLDGTFIFGGTDLYYNARVRFAGSPWLRPGGGTWGKSYSIALPKDNPLHGRKRSFNLDNHGSDGRERIAHYLLRRNAGFTTLPYFDRHSLVRFQLGGVRDATYEALDKPNRQYIDFWFAGEDRGPHFEMDDRFSFNDNGSRTGNADARALYPPYGSTAGGANKENYRWFFASRNRDGDDDFQPLMDFCQLMDSRTMPNAGFDQQVFAALDVEEFLRVWAIELNIDDWDTWGGTRGKNCYLYQSTTDGLWRLIPWDLELTFDTGQVGRFAMPASPASTFNNNFSEITRMLNRPRIKRMYYGILKEMVDTFYSTAAGSPLIAYTSRLAGSGVNLGSTTSFIGTRAGMIRNWVSPAVYPQVRLQITTNGGNDFVAATPLVDLAGNAPADIFSLIVVRNGDFAEPQPQVVFSTSSFTGWEIRGLLLPPGVNLIEVLGFNSRGDLVDTARVRVTNPADYRKPAITGVSPETVESGGTIVITGTDFHQGLAVLFNGSIAAAAVTYNESADPARILAALPPALEPGSATVIVRNIDGQASDPFPLEVVPPLPQFIRGDANLDSVVDLSDAVKILLYLFAGGSAPCLDALDVDDSGAINLTDATRNLAFIFQGGAPPPAPFPAPGPDPTGEDELGCEQGL
jgi:hypothetical protein